MSEQDVTVETEVADAPEDQVTDESQTEETQNEADEDSQEEIEVPIEEQLEKQKAKAEALEKKTARQRAAYAAMQKAMQEKDEQLKEFLAQKQQVEATKEPVIDDYETHDEYVDALAEYRAQKKLTEQREQQLKTEAKIRQEQLMAERNRQYETEKEAFVELVPDYQEAETEFNEHIQTLMQDKTADPWTQDAVVQQAYRGGNVPALINYFGENGGARLGELDKISRLTPTEAAVEIYKIQQSLKNIPAKKKEEPQPKPAKTVKSGGSTTKPASKMSGKELLKQMGVKY